MLLNDPSKRSFQFHEALKREDAGQELWSGNCFDSGNLIIVFHLVFPVTSFLNTSKLLNWPEKR